MRALTEAQRARLRYASYVLEDLALVYVETPKAACTSLKHAVAALTGIDFRAMLNTKLAAKTAELAIHDRDLFPLPTLLDLSPERLEHILRAPDTLRFCVVRNPYMRLASAWLDRFVCHSLSPRAPILTKLELPDYRADWSYLRLRFAEFVRHLYRHEWPRFSNHHWQPQTELLVAEFVDYTMTIPIEDMGRWLPRIVAHVERHGGTWPGLARFNDTPIRASATLYTATTSRLVREMFADDFSTYGYATDLSALPTSGVLPPVEHVEAIQKRNERIFSASLALRGMA